MLVSRIMTLCQWVMNFAYLNLLLVIGILAGGVVLGFFPALNAAIVVSRQLVDKPDISISRAFIYEYKDKFIISQKIGYLLFFLILIAFSNVLFWNNMQGLQISYFIKIIWLIMLIFVIAGSILIFPVAVHSKLTLKDTGRLFLFSLSQLHSYIMLAIGLIVILYAFLMFSGIFIFLVGSLTVAWIMFIHQLFVNKVLKIQKVMFEK
jgi:uncharacterized membrane protein YesL